MFTFLAGHNLSVVMSKAYMHTDTNMMSVTKVRSVSHFDLSAEPVCLAVNAAAPHRSDANAS